MPPLSALSHSPRYFNCAFLAEVPLELMAEAIEILSWDAIVEGARDSIASVLAPDASSITPDDKIDLFYNTTSAFTRVLSRIARDYAGSRPTLLTTDLEYPACVAAIDDAWTGTGPVVMAQVAAGLTAASGSPDTYLHDILIRTCNVVKPRVVFLSHVMRTTGQVLSINTVRCLREANPRVLIIIDGSQAVGNVVVTDALLQEVDFYIASGHKWLGGLTTSGFVWSRDPDRWKIADAAQSLAYRGQRQLGGSGNAAAWVSLASSIADMADERPHERFATIANYNRELGKLFCTSLSGDGHHIDVITPCTSDGEPPTGLVTIAVARAIAESLRKGLENDGYTFTVLQHEQLRWRSPRTDRFLIVCDPVFPAIKKASEYTGTRPKGPRQDFRFCFHYWHSERETLELTERIAMHIETANRPHA